MKLLVFTSLYPNAVDPHHGVFVRNRLLRWIARHAGQALVVAPVPFAPPLGKEAWTRLRDVPDREERDGLLVLHPRYLAPPGFGDGWRAALMALSVRRALGQAAMSFRPDILDAHYAYPDGAAAVRLRARLETLLGRRLPLALTCRGTDLNLLPGLPAVAQELRRTLDAADHVICVAEALRRVALELGQPATRVTTLPNGVDLLAFTPGDRAAARAAVGLPLEGRLILCVGHLTERKGQQLLVPAFAEALGGEAGARLVLVGRGEAEAALRAQCATLGISGRVRFVGAVEPSRLPDWYRAADLLVLPSLREGWPNVLLEALACGTPVLATSIWGTPEVLEGCAAARLVAPDVASLTAGLRGLDELAARNRGGAARAYAERHAWEPTLDGMQAVFERIVAS